MRRHCVWTSASAARYSSRVASTLNAMLGFRALLIGQPSLAASASFAKSSADIPGTRPTTFSALETIRQPGSSLSNVTSAETTSRSAGVPARNSLPASAIEKQDECAAATSSSGLVRPFEVSVRAAQETGSDVNAPEVIAETAPEPSARVPDQVASARRMTDIDDSCWLFSVGFAK